MSFALNQGWTNTNLGILLPLSSITTALFLSHETHMWGRQRKPVCRGTRDREMVHRPLGDICMIREDGGNNNDDA
jgi:hypothetical protein